VYAHLDEEKERDAGTWDLGTGVTNHMPGVGWRSQNSTWLCPAPCISAMTQWRESRTGGLSCSYARTMSHGRSKESTSSLGWQPTS
jgi:hypothetical protein